MKILLLGEYSNVHWTLAQGLRKLGHQVTVASNGDFWKDYPRDIDLARQPGKWGGIKLMARLCTLLPRFRGYDVVQLINPVFFELRAERLFPFYRYLRRHNGRVVLGAFGMDYYWVSVNTDERPMRYSDFNIGDTIRTDAVAEKERADWLATAKERLNRLIADDCDAIVAGLYEYDVCYQRHFPKKTHFIPCPSGLEPPGKRRPILRPPLLNLPLESSSASAVAVPPTRVPTSCCAPPRTLPSATPTASSCARPRACPSSSISN